MYLTDKMGAGVLPEFFERAISVTERRHEKDMLLMSTLTACSYALPHVTMLHGGVSQHTYYANLMTLIIAEAASGKGVINNVRLLLNPIEELLQDDDRLVFIPANISSASMLDVLYANGGEAMMMSTEIDEMSKRWKQHYSDYSDMLRQAAEHEPVGSIRIKPGGKGLKKPLTLVPKLSVLLSGTPGQLRPLLGSRENGLASRFQPYVVADRTPFDSSVLDNSDHYVSGGARDVYMQLGKELLGRWNWLRSLGRDIIWSITAEQEAILKKVADEIAMTLFEERQVTADGKTLGMPKDFEPNFNRTLVNVKRMGMILSTLRLTQEQMEKISADAQKEATPVLYCEDTDFGTMLVLLEQLLRHSAMVHLMLPAAEPLLPSNSPTSASARKAQLFAALPERFTTKQAVEAGAGMGISRCTVMNYISDLCASGEIVNKSRGHYQKK